MKNIEGLEIGDRVKLVKGDYIFVGKLTTKFSEFKKQDLLFVEKVLGEGYTGYFLGWYDWDSIEKV